MKSDRYTFEEIMTMASNGELPEIIIWAAPVMFSLVAVEYFLEFKRNRKAYDEKDLWASTAIGIGNVIVTVLSKFVTFFAIWACYYYLAPWTIPATWWSFILCLIALDFCRYWAHRIAHEQRFWWATHITHHSSEQYYFGVSFRLSWVQHLKLIFFLPVAIAGFDPVIFFICHQIEVLYQFWIHTEYIKKLPTPIEYIFTTPSHHRVHHATNDQYIDKNYGSTFIIWDRMFGTFEPEKEQPVYGITTPVESYNPVYLVFHEFINIFRDMKKLKSWKNRFRLLWSLPGSEYDGDKDAFIRDKGINT